MSSESIRPRASRASSVLSEGRRLPARQSLAPGANSGGVSGESRRGSGGGEGWEICDCGAPQPVAQAGHTSKRSRAVAEVGVSYSSPDLWALSAEDRAQRRQAGRRGGTCRHASQRSKGAGDGPQGIRTPAKLRKLQRALYHKAKAQPKYRFWSLYGEISRGDILEHALRLVARNGGAAGIDGQTIEEITASPEVKAHWLEHLQQELRARTYRPAPVRREYLPKPDGGQRPLGIPTVKDRVVQMALYLVLMPIFEADYHPLSFGFRPRRNAHQAMDAIRSALISGRTEVVDADLSKYFDTIPHDRLLRAVARRVSDGSVLRLIKLWLKAPIGERRGGGGWAIRPNLCGTPQGGVISPLLANLYLNPLDWAVNEKVLGRPRLIRYADDLVILCGRGRGKNLLERLREWLRRQGLALNEQKTRLVDFQQESFRFLGFQVSCRPARNGRPYPHTEPAPKSQTALREAVRQELNHWTLWRSPVQAVERVNRILRGWAGYFVYQNSTRVCVKLRRWTRDRLRRWLWRKSACTTALWEDYPDHKLHNHYGLWPLTVKSGWTLARDHA